MIDERYRGFAEIAHGGYVGGLLADSLGGSGRLALRRPVPLGRPLEIDRSKPDRAALRDGDQEIASAVSSDLDLDPPTALTFSDAERASSSYAGFSGHLFPSCFGCGPDRDPGDGLRIFPGPVRGTDLLAAPWTPDASLGDQRGIVRSEFVWAAFDCPQLWALIHGAASDSPERAVTGALETRLAAPVRAGERHVILSWPMGREGRRLDAGAALFSERGECLAVSRQTAVVSEWGVPLGVDGWRAG